LGFRSLVKPRSRACRLDSAVTGSPAWANISTRSSFGTLFVDPALCIEMRSFLTAPDIVGRKYSHVTTREPGDTIAT
jgi:hypothetical protein